MKLTRRRFAAPCVALMMSVLCCESAFAQDYSGTVGRSAPFSGIVAFGDSLTDTGNLFALTGLPPAPAYFDGRFSNGPLWIEYLAAEMGLGTDQVQNFAVGGATTGRENYHDPSGGLPGVLDQLDQFEASLGGRRADPRALYTVFAGSNDIFLEPDPAVAIGRAMQNTALAVHRLRLLGARRIMVVNLPDLGLTPYGQAVGAGPLSALSAAYNGNLELVLAQLNAAGAEAILLDVAGATQRVVNDPAAFGLIDVTTPALYTGTSGAGFLFWDQVHPTTEGHAIFADEAWLLLQQNYPKVWSTPVGQ